MEVVSSDFLRVSMIRIKKDFILSSAGHFIDNKQLI